jgi:hypothetical protein
LNVIADELMAGTRHFAGDPEAFVLEYPSDTFAPLVSGSVLHGPVGYWLVAALASLTAGRSSSHDAIENYLDLAEEPYRLAEFAFGSAGPLWGCSLLLRSELNGVSQVRIRAVGRRLLARTWETLGRHLANVRGVSGKDNLGFAHGRAGVLYAALAFCRDSRTALPVGLREELENLACLAEVTPRGVSWPATFGSPGAPGRWLGERESWCNGAAGFVPLWSLAFEVFGHAIYRELALKTAAYLLANTAFVSRTLCCGLAGHATAIRYAERLEPGQRWAQFSGEAIDACAVESLPLNGATHGLFKGAAGVLLGGESWL